MKNVFQVHFDYPAHATKHGINATCNNADARQYACIQSEYTFCYADTYADERVERDGISMSRMKMMNKINV